MSFTDMRITDIRSPFAVEFVGLENYATAFADPVFRRAAANTAVFVLLGVPLTIIAGLAAAIALDRGVGKLRAVFRVGFYTPVITSIVAVAVVWRFLLQPDTGLVNTVLGWVGIDGPHWLGDQRTALLSLVVMAVWRNFGTSMVIFLAGLQAVDRQLHEAAALDGAGAWQRFLNITLPSIRPTMLFVLVTTSIGYLQFFEEPFVMTGGGPLNSTVSASMYTYEQFGFGNYGVAGAMAYLTFLVIGVVTLVQFRLMREK
ncbi:carbohydrate ABC transporter permease [Brachybacterium sp. J153]|nr:sugar ABC transporter permease [Brachybacterium sp. J153]MEE1618355.1 sugar ABC transporter permease [Brachybacterium sp. J153]